MHTSKTQKNKSSNSHTSKSFFNKSGEGSFFSESKETNKPFFGAHPIQTKLTTRKMSENGKGKTKNKSGMPDSLKGGLEQLSGMDLSNVRVHKNSSKPAQLNALAYTQGQDIHLGPGHEKHLPHEGWHVVQQMQGRVTPTTQANGVSINDDAGLEREADVMGAKALQMKEVEQVMTSSGHQEATSLQFRTGKAAKVTRLADLKKRSAISIPEIEQTAEFRSYMDPKLIWQWKFHTTEVEAWSACFWIWYSLRQGERVNWDTDARRFLLDARRRIKKLVRIRELKSKRANPLDTDNPPTKTPQTTPLEKAKTNAGGPGSDVIRYRVEHKAWIPHARVLDPEDPPFGDNTYYRGDGHRGYKGSYRVLNWTVFETDGFTVTSFNGGGDYGVTHRDYVENGKVVKSDQGLATKATSRKLVDGYKIQMRIASANPLVRGWAPDIDALLEVTVIGGALALNWKTDGFPSHGYQVDKDGKTVATQITNDASNVTVSGVKGSMQILAGLTRWERKGSSFVWDGRKVK